MFAASCCQSRTLQLKPWEAAPCDIADPEHPSDNEQFTSKLLQRMLDHCVSRWCHDPEAAFKARR